MIDLLKMIQAGQAKQAQVQSMNSYGPGISQLFQKMQTGQANGIFDQASNMRTDALNAPVPERDNSFNKGDAVLLGLAGLLRLFGMGTGQDFDQTANSTFTRRAQLRNEKYEQDTNTYNRKTQAQLAAAESLENKGLRAREDIRDSRNFQFQQNQAKQAQGNFEKQFGHNVKQDELQNARQERAFGFELEKFGYQKARTEVLDVRDALAAKADQERWDKSFNENVRQFGMTFKHNSEMDNKRLAQAKADLDLRRDMMKRGIFESDRSFTRGAMESDRSFNFGMEKYNASEAARIFKEQGNAEKIFKDAAAEVARVDKEIDRVKNKLANGFWGQKATDTARDLNYIKQLEARREKALRKIEEGNSPVSLGNPGKPANGQIDLGGGFKAEPVK